MLQHKNEVEAYEVLRAILIYDISKRFKVVQEEVIHFIKACDFRTGIETKLQTPTDSNEDEGISPTELDVAGQSQTEFLKRLALSGKNLLNECYQDQNEIEIFIDLIHMKKKDKINEEIESIILSKKRASQKLGFAHFSILWHSKMLKKVSVFSERIGELHDRLFQFLQRTNPDNPDPTLRRRSEQGLLDKYLSEFSRWIHRDIVNLVDNLGANYPYKITPTTFQHWTYKHTASQHSFVPFKDHSEWVGTRYDKANQIDKPNVFTIITLSYWMQERTALQPIIAHEISHQVLRDIYGPDTDITLVENDTSEFGKFYRSIKSCLEEWFANGFNNRLDSIGASNAITIEIVCDILSASRFSKSYLYAWILEILNYDVFSEAFFDRYGMLGGINFPDSNERNILVDEFVYDTLKRVSDLDRLIPELYLRGVVLIEYIKSIGIEKDKESYELILAAEVLIEIMIDLFTAGDEQYKIWLVEFGNELANSVCKSELNFDASPIVKIVSTLWKVGPKGKLYTPSLNIQSMSFDFRKVVLGVFEFEGGDEKIRKHFELISDGFKLPNTHTYAALPWRIEWALEYLKLKINNEIIKKLLPGVRSILYLGMDDYLYRTANPSRLMLYLSKDFWTKKLNETYNEPIKLTGNIYKNNEIEDRYSSAYVVLLEDYMARSLNEIEFPKLRESNDVYTFSDKIQNSSFPIRINKLRWLGDSVLWKGDRLKSWVCDNNNKIRPHYFLNLYKFGKLNSVDFDSNTSSGLKVCSRLIGRYDAVSFDENNSLNLDLLPKHSSEFYSEFCNKAYASKFNITRPKKLIHVGSGDVGNITNNNLFGLFFISLKWDPSRTVVARWLTSNRLLDCFPNLTINTFLSDGWEDIIVFVSGKNRNVSTEIEILSEMFMFHDQFLSLHPMISSIESMLLDHVLKYNHNNVHVRFVLNLFGTSTLSEDVLIRLRRIDHVRISSLASHKDFEVVFRDRASVNYDLIKSTYDQLLDISLSMFRVEMRVAWDGNPPQDISTPV